MSTVSPENWLRANLIGELCLNDALQAVLHNDQGDPSYVGLTRNGIDLHREMTNFKNSCDGQELTRKKVIRPFQWDILCPASGASNSDDWDITIKTVVIQYKANLPQPIRGWKFEPFLLDITKASFVTRAKNLRNELKHGTIQDLDAKYNDVMTRMERILIGLDYQNFPMFNHLKSTSFERYTERLLNTVKADFEKEIKIIKDDLKKINDTQTIVEELERNSTIKVLIKRTLPIVLVTILILGCCIWIYNNKFHPNKLAMDNRSLNKKLAKKQLCELYNTTINKENFYPFTRKWREKFYIQLLLHYGNVYDKENLNADMEFHRKKLLKPAPSSVTIDNIYSDRSKNNRLVLLSGAGGVGKTYTMETAILFWCESRIWNFAEFVFLFKFREINVKQYSSFKHMLMEEYKELFHYISYDNLTTTGRKIIIILDGIDEFIGLEELKFERSLRYKRPISKAIMELLDPKLKTLGGQYQLIVTGRPFAVETLNRRLDIEEIQFKVYDVLGFNETQVDHYISTYIDRFPGTKLAMNDLNTTIRSSEYLQLMSRTPVFLWSLCELYAYKHFDTKYNITTKTEIFSLQITMFLHKHLNSPKKTLGVGRDIFEIYKSNDVDRRVFFLAKLASDMYGKGLAFIPLTEEYKKIVKNESLEISGIVSQVQLSLSEIYIQFHHLSIQEFLTALHHVRLFIYSSKKRKKKVNNSGSYGSQENSKKTFLGNSNSYFGRTIKDDVIPMYFGILGAITNSSESSTILKLFTRSLKLDIIDEVADKELIAFARARVPLEVIYEYKKHLTGQLLNIVCDSIRINAHISILNYDSFYLQHFLNRYSNVQCIPSITIENGRVSSTTIKHACGISKIVLEFHHSLDTIRKDVLELLNNQLLQCKEKDYFKHLDIFLPSNFSISYWTEIFQNGPVSLTCHKNLKVTGYIDHVTITALYDIFTFQRCRKEFNINTLTITPYSKSNYTFLPMRHYNMLADLSLHLHGFKFSIEEWNDVPDMFDEEQFKYFLNLQTSIYKRKHFNRCRCEHYPIRLRSVDVAGMKLYLYRFPKTKNLQWNFEASYESLYYVPASLINSIKLDSDEYFWYM